MKTIITLLSLSIALLGADKTTLKQKCATSTNSWTIAELQSHRIDELRSLLANLPDDPLCKNSNIFYIVGKLGEKKEVEWLKKRMVELEKEETNATSEVQKRVFADTQTEILYAYASMMDRNIKGAEAELKAFLKTVGPLQEKAAKLVKK